MSFRFYKKILDQQTRQQPLQVPDKIEVSGKDLPVIFELKNNKRSTCQLKDGRLILRISIRLSKKVQQKTIDQLLGQFKKYLEKKPLQLKVKRQKNYHRGQIIKTVFGSVYTVEVNSGKNQHSSCHVKQGMLKINLARGLSKVKTQNHINILVRRMIANKERPCLKDYIQHLNQQYFANRLKVQQVRFKKQTSLWGSCSRQNNINLSFRLLFLPKKLLQYVCVHEMCHLLQRNHGPKFWAEVERVVPDYQESRQRLKKYS